METRVILKNARISPKKLRFLLPAVKDLDPLEAKNVLSVDKSKSASILLGVLNSALSNLSSQGVKLEKGMLKFKTFKVDEGLKLKRWRAGSRGSPRMYVRRRAHITIEMEVKDKKGSNIKVKKKVISKDKDGTKS